MDSEGIRELCQEITMERDSREIWKLLAQLREVVAIQYDEARLRIGELARHYHDYLQP